MDELVPPLSAEDQMVLQDALPLEPPEGLEQEVLDRLRTSVGAPLSASGTAAISSSTLLVAVSMLGIGVVAGVVLDRTLLAPEPEALRVEAIVKPLTPQPAPAAPVLPLPEEAAPTAEAAPTPSPPVASTESKRVRQKADAALAHERELIDTARSALLHRNPTGAIAVLQRHAALATGRLAEERESLWVQALAMQGALPEAKARAAQFHQRFPNSLVGAAVDAVAAEP